MEWFAGDFLSALAAIVIIDLVLAGDNAIVIALAARNLPADLRKRAIVWGTFGAIAVRTAMTLVVVWLLKIPGLLLLGGSVLIWIAYKLVVDDGHEGATPGLDPAKSFWGAMKTIVVADALMGLDNVLAVAGAAQGSFVLVVVGLLISIPIVIWGSQFVLKLVGRYPGIIYLGAGVLAWTAVKMIAGEPLLHAALTRYPILTWIAYIAVIGGVISSGFMANYDKVRARVAAHLVDIWSPAAASAGAGITKGDTEMLKLLVPVDGSPNSLKAVRHVVNRFMENRTLEVHLLHVRTPLSQHVARFVSKRNRAAYHGEEAEKALRAARSLLEQFNVPYCAHVELGEKALVIDRMAQSLGVDQIVMGTARKNSFTRMIEDSVTNKVLELTQVPVEVVAGESISKLERIGIPAGIGALLALLYAASE